MQYTKFGVAVCSGRIKMKKRILITGATDGIGLETAKMLAIEGHQLLIHGRNQEKLTEVVEILQNINPEVSTSTYLADLSSLKQVGLLADNIAADYDKIDVIINNAGVYSVTNKKTPEELDARFVVNVIAPYLLTRKLLRRMDSSGRIINLSSAAQAPFELNELKSISAHSDGAVYAKSKLALAMWTRQMALESEQTAPVFVAINPASMLGSKMVKEAYCVNGGDLKIGANVLKKAAFDVSFADASGKYFDNDIGQFSQLHPFAFKSQTSIELIDLLNELVNSFL